MTSDQTIQRTCSLSSTCRAIASALATMGLVLSLTTPVMARAQQLTPTRLGPREAYAVGDFTQITAVRELLDGRLLIADRANRSLFLVTLSTGTTERIGRDGDGPGEYRGIGWLYPLSGDSTLLTDWKTGRWLTLQGGRIVDTETRPFDGALGPLLSGVDTAGRALALLGYPEGVARSRADSLIILVGRRSSQLIDTVGVVTGRGDSFTVKPARGGGPAIMIPSNPLASEEQALLFPDGWIAIARTDPYRVEWLTPDRSWIRGTELPFERIVVDDRQKCWAMQRHLKQAMGDSCDPSFLSYWPDFLPPFLPQSVRPSLFASPDGRLIIARTPAAGANLRIYDIVDRQGMLTGQIALDLDEALISTGRRSVYVVVTDANGVEGVNKHAWPWSSDTGS